MSSQLTAFVAVTGLTVAVALAAVAFSLIKRRAYAFPLLFGGIACLLFQYVGLPFFLNFVASGMASLGIHAESYAAFACEILAVALYEAILTLIVFLLLKKLLSYPFALAFGAGYWCFSALTGSVSELITMLSAKQTLFYGTELEIVASGLQLPLQLPLYLAMCVAIALCIKLKKPGAFFFALLLNILFRCILASYAALNVPMLIALGFLVMYALLLICYFVKAKADFPVLPEDDGAHIEENGEAEASAPESFDAPRALEAEPSDQDAQGADGDGSEADGDGASEDVAPETTQK